jgi:hypothetical protein
LELAFFKSSVSDWKSRNTCDVRLAEWRGVLYEDMLSRVRLTAP